LHFDRFESSGITSDVAKEVHIQVMRLVKPCLLVGGSQATLPKINVNIFASQLYQNQVKMPPPEHTKLSPVLSFFPLPHTPNSPLAYHTNLLHLPTLYFASSLPLAEGQAGTP
jgi:hypothetical protein